MKELPDLTLEEVNELIKYHNDKLKVLEVYKSILLEPIINTVEPIKRRPIGKPFNSTVKLV